VGGINGMEAFHVVSKDVQTAVSAGKVVAIATYRRHFVDVMPRGVLVTAVAYRATLRRLEIRFDVGGLACLREV